MPPLRSASHHTDPVTRRFRPPASTCRLTASQLIRNFRRTGRERRERTDGQAEVEANAVKMVRADPRAGQDQQPVLGQELAKFIDDRKDHLVAPVHFIYVNMPFGQATWDRPTLSEDDAYDVAGFVVSHPRQPREGEVAKDFSNPYDKPEDFPWGSYADSFSETQHKYGPFDVIRAEDAAARERAKKEREAKGNPASPS